MPPCPSFERISYRPIFVPGATLISKPLPSSPGVLAGEYYSFVWNLGERISNNTTVRAERQSELSKICLPFRGHSVPTRVDPRIRQLLLTTRTHVLRTHR